jgi:lipoprotein-anchoring transpeptidase ErfK/SrfK
MARKSRKNARKFWGLGLGLGFLVLALVIGSVWRWKETVSRRVSTPIQVPAPSGAIPTSTVVRLPAMPVRPASNPEPTVVITPRQIPESIPARKNEIVPAPSIPLAPSPTAIPETHAKIPGPPPIPDSWVTEIPPVTNILLAQIALSGYAISAGSIDGTGGVQTEAALQAFQQDHGLEPTGRLDLPTEQSLQLRHPPFVRRSATEAELARLHPLPGTWLGKASAERLEFSTWIELLGEAAHAHPAALTRWNAVVDWNRIRPSDVVLAPASDYPPARRAALVRLSLTGHWIRAFGDQGNLLAHFPCSIGRIAEKRPVGLLHVVSVAKDPNYTFNPAVFPESPEAQAVGRKLVLPPGPNNPVGVAWIGLDRPGYGIHGTPAPEQVGRTESHGCFRLANWNADYLRQMVRVGTPVQIEP